MNERTEGEKRVFLRLKSRKSEHLKGEYNQNEKTKTAACSIRTARAKESEGKVRTSSTDRKERYGRYN